MRFDNVALHYNTQVISFAQRYHGLDRAAGCSLGQFGHGRVDRHLLPGGRYGPSGQEQHQENCNACLVGQCRHHKPPGCHERSNA
ncbi:hypothetical protein D3C87_1734740 [compost metagenome]